MRILFLTNIYPPYSNGGYEQLCQEVAQAFTARGHDVTVITSRNGGQTTNESDGLVRVHRCLELELEGGLASTVFKLISGRAASERRNVAMVEGIIEKSKPDAALVWGMWNVPQSVPATVERLLPDNTAYYFCDYWPTLPDAYIQRLQEPSRRKVTRSLKSLLAAVWLPRLKAKSQPSLDFRRTACVSHAVRSTLVAGGLPMEQAEIIHLGVRPEFHVERQKDPPLMAEEVLRLVYTGRLTADKGVHTAIEAVKLLNEYEHMDISLDIFGNGDREYVGHLKSVVQNQQLNVRFKGGLPRPALLEQLPHYDVLLFPSIWEEPFSHAVLEGMAAGLIVVGTTRGGTGEVLRDGETGLAFHAGDAVDLAEKIRRLKEDDDLRNQLATRGRNVVISEFTLERTVAKLEAFLAADVIWSEPVLR
jgi:glycogen synthase